MLYLQGSLEKHVWHFQMREGMDLMSGINILL